MSKIVLVDDDEKIAELSGQSLKTKGLDVEIFTEPLKARDFVLENSDYSVLITDNIMPVMNGMELIRVCLEARPELNCILATGDDTCDTSDFSGHNNVRIISKPFRRKELMELIESFN